jgi:hypothetical protein
VHHRASRSLLNTADTHWCHATLDDAIVTATHIHLSKHRHERVDVRRPVIVSKGDAHRADWLPIHYIVVVPAHMPGL